MMSINPAERLLVIQRLYTLLRQATKNTWKWQNEIKKKKEKKTLKKKIKTSQLKVTTYQTKVYENISRKRIKSDEKRVKDKIGEPYLRKEFAFWP